MKDIKKNITNIPSSSREINVETSIHPIHWSVMHLLCNHSRPCNVESRIFTSLNPQEKSDPVEYEPVLPLKTNGMLNEAGTHSEQPYEPDELSTRSNKESPSKTPSLGPIITNTELPGYPNIILSSNNERVKDYNNNLGVSEEVIRVH